jgi:hypothetical protein
VSNYKAVIKNSGAGIVAMVVRVDRDGEEQVDNVFGMRHYSSYKAAETQTAKYLAKQGARI